MVIYLEQKKIHFDLRFILTYNIHLGDFFQQIMEDGMITVDLTGHFEGRRHGREG